MKLAKIIYGHHADSFQNLKIAGDFSDWEPLSMERSKDGDLWEYTIDLTKLPSGTEKVHFKFIDDNGNWFTDEDYAKELDSSSNENNVRLFTEEELGGKDFEIDDEGPVSPAPSLEGDFSENYYEPAKMPESRERDESVGGSAVIVNHSDVEDEGTRDLQSPETAETALSNRDQNPGQYKDVLARIVAFFTNLFRSWFG